MKHIVQKQLAQSIATMQAVLADESISDTIVTTTQTSTGATGTSVGSSTGQRSTLTTDACDLTRGKPGRGIKPVADRPA